MQIFEAISLRRSFRLGKWDDNWQWFGFGQISKSILEAVQKATTCLICLHYDSNDSKPPLFPNLPTCLSAIWSHEQRCLRADLWSLIDSNNLDRAHVDAPAPWKKRCFRGNHRRCNSRHGANPVRSEDWCSILHDSRISKRWRKFKHLIILDIYWYLSSWNFLNMSKTVKDILH